MAHGPVPVRGPRFEDPCTPQIRAVHGVGERVPSAVQGCASDHDMSSSRLENYALLHVHASGPESDTPPPKRRKKFPRDVSG